MIPSRNDADIAQDEADNFAWLALWIDIEDKRGPCRLTNLFQEAEQEGCLAHSRCRDQSNETAVAGITIFQRRKGLAMRGTLIQAPGIGSSPERIFSKSVVSRQHSTLRVSEVQQAQVRPGSWPIRPECGTKDP